eukprot:1928904-Amphidinium_carterae.4
MSAVKLTGMSTSFPQVSLAGIFNQTVAVSVTWGELPSTPYKDRPLDGLMYTLAPDLSRRSNQLRPRRLPLLGRGSIATAPTLNGIAGQHIHADQGQ